MSNSLAFQSTKFAVIDHNGQPWIRSSELAKALQYSDERKVTHLFKRHEDEFTNDMSVVLNLGTTDMPTMTRVFSLRGCHLLAMFARTDVAKAFRKWVLDVLETLNKAERPALPSVTISPEQQRQLHDIMDAKVKMLAPELSGKARAEAWTRFNRHFRISKYEQLPAERFSEGTEYLINMVLKTAGVVAVPDVAPVNIPQRRIEVELALRQMGDALRAFYTDMNRVVPPKTYVTYPRAIGNAANLTKAALDAMGSQLEVVQLAAAVSFDVYGVLSDR